MVCNFVRIKKYPRSKNTQVITDNMQFVFNNNFNLTLFNIVPNVGVMELQI